MFDDPLVREIALVLAVKLLLLTLLWFAFFRPAAPAEGGTNTAMVVPAVMNSTAQR